MTDAETRQTRPALPTLQADQQALLAPEPGDELRFGLRDGFPSRRELINWYQRAIVRTFGYIAEDWAPADLERDRVLLGSCLTGPDREAFDGDLDVDDARAYRLKLEEVIVLPACQRAYNDLRKRAGEYVDESDNEKIEDLDPASQDHVAMRPAFQIADRQQSRALRALWGGFEDIEHLQSWLHSLNEPTNGALEEEVPARIGRDPAGKKHLLDGRADSEVDARRYRERFAISELLPAFAQGIKRMEAGELASRSGSSLSPAQG